MTPMLLWLPVALPVLGGILLPLLKIRNKRARNGYVMAVTLLTSLAAAVLVLDPPVGSSRLIHFMGSLDFAVSLDGPGRVFAALMAALWPLATLYAFSYMEEDAASARFFTLFTVTYGIAMGVSLAANLLTLYCFFEMLSLITVPLVMHDFTPEAVRAARKYLYYMLGGTAFAFIGLIFVIVYGETNYFTAGGVFAADTVAANASLLRMVYLFTFFGFGAKAAVFPLHAWLPDASVAPTPVTALLHAVAVVNAGVFAITRMTYMTFGTALLYGSGIHLFLWCVVLFTIFYGSSMAVKETHLKRRLAYSTVANLSYMLLGVILLTPEGLAAGMLHMVFHGVMKIALFCCAGAVLVRAKRAYVGELGGLAHAMPVTVACFTAASLCLTGVPPFSGFVSKWALAEAALGAENGLLGAISVGVLLVSALLTAIYTLTVSVRAYCYPADARAAGKGRTEADARMLFPIVLTTAASLALGVCAQPLFGWLTAMAAGLFR